MPLSQRFAIRLLLTAAVCTQAQSFVAIHGKPAHSVDLESRRVRIFPNGDLKGTSVNAITLLSEGYSVPANPSDRLSALPPWVYSERYDIEARAASGSRQMSLSDGTAAS
jgi:uncharacterized protein (TIGR03435 family)